jgi:hypothetical protein
MDSYTNPDLKEKMAMDGGGENGGIKRKQIKNSTPTAVSISSSQRRRWSPPTVAASSPQSCCRSSSHLLNTGRRSSSSLAAMNGADKLWYSLSVLVKKHSGAAQRVVVENGGVNG